MVRLNVLNGNQANVCYDWGSGGKAERVDVKQNIFPARLDHCGTQAIVLGAGRVQLPPPVEIGERFARDSGVAEADGHSMWYSSISDSRHPSRDINHWRKVM